MITLAHLRSLLERALTHTENPAIVRLAARTVEGLAAAYLPHGARVVVTIPAGRAWPQQTYIQTASLGPWLAEPTERSTLDLTDPGTAHALMVALALALGFDPGPLALRISWHPGTTSFGERYWCLSNNTEARTFFEWSQADGDFTAPNVAIETNDAKALALAALRVLEHP